MSIIVRTLLTLMLFSSCSVRPKIPLLSEVRVVDIQGNMHYYENVYMQGFNYCLVHEKDELIEYKIGKN